MAMGIPTGASSNMPMGGCPERVMSSLMTMFVDVLTSDTELVRMEANARGRRYRDGLVACFIARPRTMGMKKAVAAVLLINADRKDTESIITATRTAVLLPTCPNMYRPTKSTIPVWDRAAVMMKKPRIIMTVPLPKPANAWSVEIKLRAVTARRTPSATTSAGILSQANRKMAAPNTARHWAICGVISMKTIQQRKGQVGPDDQYLEKC
jgi:hypothetical protein